MVRKILVPVHKLDAIGLHIFHEALDLAKSTGASLKLLHVISVDDESSPSIINLLNTPDNKKRWEEFEKPGLDMLHSLTAEATAAGVECESVQTLGRPTHVICDAAKACGADVIMIGRRGISGLSEILLGSVSNYVAHYAPCSVIVVQGGVLPDRNGGRATQTAAAQASQ